MSQASGRIVCPQCGANSFDTVTACWKCGATFAAAVPRPASTSQSSQRASSQTQGPQPPTAMEAMAYRGASAARMLGNPSAANRAALWLGLLMPYFGLPIGLAFVMCDDRRRQEVGRICILWSCVSLAVHLLLSFVAMLGMREYIAIALNSAMGAARRAGSGGGGGGGGMDLN